MEMLQKAFDLHRNGLTELAEEIYLEIIKKEPENYAALNLYGILLAQKNSKEQGLLLLEKACQLQPKDAIFRFNKGNIQMEIGKTKEAILSYSHAVSINPNYAQAYFARGNALVADGNHEGSIVDYKKSIALSPRYLEAIVNLGNAYKTSKKYTLALDAYEKALKLESKNHQVIINKGCVYIEMEKFQLALNCFNQIIKVDKFNIDANYNKAIVEYKNKNYGNSLEITKLILEINPKNHEALNLQGQIFKDLKKYNESIIEFKKCMQIKNDYYDAYINLAGTYLELKRYESALSCLQFVIEKNYQIIHAYSNQGIIYREMNRLEDAKKSFETVIAIDKKNARVLALLADIFYEQRQYKIAVQKYNDAYQIDPNYNYLLGTYLHSKMALCEWTDFESLKSNLVLKAKKRQRITHCLPALAITDRGLTQKKIAEIWTENECPKNSALGEIAKVKKTGKIKIGYFSGDYINHPVACLMVEALELHNKEKFEIIAFSYGKKSKDSMTNRLERAFDRFIDCENYSDLEIAQLSRDLSIDVAIDLSGFTANGRYGIFSFRVAPIQINYLGYPGTMGADYMDYIICDKYLVPEQYQINYTEKIIYLPCFQVSDRKRPVSEKYFTKNELGLPENKFIFCNFNNTYKITPQIFDVWANILINTSNSILWLLCDNNFMQDNLIMEIEKRGVKRDRLYFAGRVNAADYLARFKVADLFLDTFPFNAGTTANDALWMGLPVLTYSGETFASRMAGSLLTALDMTELICLSLEEYKNKAIDICEDSKQMNNIKKKMHSNKFSKILFNTDLNTQYLEKAYEVTFDLYQNGLNPGLINIEAIELA